MYRLDVPLVWQQKGMSCWYACAQMVLEYFKDSVGLERLKNSRAVQDLVEKDEGIKGPGLKVMKKETSPDTSTPTAIKEGKLFKRLPKTINYKDLNALSFQQMLSSYGPIYCGGYFGQGMGQSGLGHVVVLTGVDVGSATLFYNDPGPLGQGFLDKTATVEEFVKMLDTDSKPVDAAAAENGMDVTRRRWMLRYSTPGPQVALAGPALETRQTEAKKSLDAFVAWCIT